MKKIQIIIVSFLMLGVGFLISSCEPDSHSLGRLPDESILNFEVTQDFDASPGGNIVNVKGLTPGIIPYWSFTSSDGKELGHSNLNETSVTFPFAGTYNINFTAFDKGGSVTSTKTVTVEQNDANAFSDPRWAMLTNGVEGKTWILKMVAPIEFVGTNIHSPAMDETYGVSNGGGDWSWYPNFSDIPWAGYEDKDWGEITFDLDGGYNVTVKQTSVETGSSDQTTTTGTFSYTQTSDFSEDKIVFNGGVEMLHMNGDYSSSFSIARLYELTDTTLSYVAIREDGQVLIYHLIPKP
jgi:hypothetical protein